MPCCWGLIVQCRWCGGWGIRKSMNRVLLRNSEGVTLLIFSKSIGEIDATSVKILALKEACVLFSKSRWAQRYSLVLETDCDCLVEWLNRPVLSPYGFKRLVGECIESCAVCSWSIRAVSREVNFTADKLAKLDYAIKLQKYLLVLKIGVSIGKLRKIDEFHY
ncbi:hypothetical protein V6N12_058568 [Hibiscus sabdariffa]|uniref:RNase H type-1 domain-containing protein n=1 Tax=Hibiscus sabdariffa TaxID=183260 RepID=A0ABR2EV65_9ROSI